MNFTEQDEDDMEDQMASDFCYYYDIVDSLQGPAWNALETQEDVNGWAESLQGLTEILDFLSEALHDIGYFYSKFEDIADNVDKFIATPDAVKIVPRSIEFGLRIDSLNTFGNRAQPLRKTIFPDGTSDVARIDISPATYDFGSVPIGKYSQAVKVTLWNTGNVDIPISSVYLTDPRSFEIVQGLDESVISVGRHADLFVRFRPSGPFALYDTGLGVTSTIAGLEVQEVQFRGNNLKLKPIPWLHIVGMCDTACRLGALITVADSVTDVNFSYTAPVEVIGGVMSEDFSTVWWLTDSCALSEDFGQAASKCQAVLLRRRGYACRIRAGLGLLAGSAYRYR